MFAVSFAALQLDGSIQILQNHLYAGQVKQELVSDGGKSMAIRATSCPAPCQVNQLKNDTCSLKLDSSLP
ncbi:hypothetical protein CVM52_17650 [Pseudooceanicola lipolyticus]|uniref:Uncharacterized protein n=1 Tax=Pseudooceanicola lipolyticus TaxID=2029104 RepID=A0A2M8IXU5_9RHOB|nr:hypothetical protein CVM52_17650 [Pseudooceanicola lipolyticus]